MIKKNLLLALAFSAFAMVPNLPAEEEEFSFNLDEFDDIVAIEEANRGGADDLASDIFIGLGLMNLKAPLWTNLRPNKGRDVLYLMPHKIAALEYGGLACSLFFNMTSKMQVTADNSLDFDQLNPAGIALALGDKIGLFHDSAVIESNTRGLITLLKKITLQERKLGSFIQGGFVRGPFSFQINTSLQIGERNFWLNKQDRQEVQDIVALMFPDSPSEDKKYFYMIKAGLGDTRLKLGFNALNAPLIVTDVGAEMIVPTSRISTRQKISYYPDALVVDVPTLKQAIYGSLDNFREYLLTPELGNGGHFGFGFYFESKATILQELAELWTRVSYDQFLKTPEYRMMLATPTRSLDNISDSGDASSPTAISNFLKENIIPTPVKTEVTPGGIFNFVFSVRIPIKKWTFSYGYDLYAQQKEEFGNVLNNSLTIKDFQFEKTIQRGVVQHKLFSETSYTKHFRVWNATFSWGGDTTIFARNIGKDWTLFFKVSSAF